AVQLRPPAERGFILQRGQILPPDERLRAERDGHHHVLPLSRGKLHRVREHRRGPAARVGGALRARVLAGGDGVHRVPWSYDDAHASAGLLKLNATRSPLTFTSRSSTATSFTRATPPRTLRNCHGGFTWNGRSAT